MIVRCLVTFPSAFVRPFTARDKVISSLSDKETRCFSAVEARDERLGVYRIASSLSIEDSLNGLGDAESELERSRKSP